VLDYLHKYITVTPHTLLQQPKMKKLLQLYADQIECIRKEYCQLKVSRVTNINVQVAVVAIPS